MKIHLKTKRNLETLKLGHISGIFALILRGKWKSGV